MGGTADYAYNGLGERVSKTIMGQTKTTYYYDGADLVLEKSGTASTAYVAGSRIDEILTDSRKFSYQTDGQGSVLNLTDPLGVKSNAYSYTAFGSTKAQTGAVINTWLYTGRQYDSESGLYFNRNRYYSPYLGRFITKDPIGIRGGVNLYAYTQNNPVSYIDPWGFEAVPTSSPIDWVISAAGSGSLSQAFAGAVKNAIIDTIGESFGQTGHRYVGAGEVGQISRTGQIPNVNKAGDPKNIFYTTDRPLSSSSQAKHDYNLGTTPTHRVDFDLTGTKPNYAGSPVMGGGAATTELASPSPIGNIKGIVRLDD